jgi:predicted RNase H-like HicB family nuclease
MKYPVIYEPTATGFAASVPDLPGCVAAGESLNDTRALIAGAIELHLAGMREDGTPIPAPSLLELVEVAG